MADVTSVRLAEGETRRTPEMRLSNAEAAHKTFREGFSVRRVSASSHTSFPRCNCGHSFDIQINEATSPAGVCPLVLSPTCHYQDRALPGLSPVMDGSRRDNSRSGTSARHQLLHAWPDGPGHVAGAARAASRLGLPQAHRYARHGGLVPTPERRNGHISVPGRQPGDGVAGVPFVIGRLAGCRHEHVHRPCPLPQ
jgi:hypothetical protein